MGRCCLVVLGFSWDLGLSFWAGWVVSNDRMADVCVYFITWIGLALALCLSVM
uniref:Uncharacterized protein n=1 Tax=Oryza brachyantha TaxID=4533 RepID=J3M7B3_ORYBR